jgi:hypothetical protein
MNYYLRIIFWLKFFSHVLFKILSEIRICFQILNWMKINFYLLTQTAYSAAKFTIHVNSRKNSNFFAWIHKFSHFFTKSFFYRYGRQTKPKIASHGLFHKKSFTFPIRGGNMDFFDLSPKDFLWKSPWEAIFGFVCRHYR